MSYTTDSTKKSTKYKGIETDMVVSFNSREARVVKVLGAHAVLKFADGSTTRVKTETLTPIVAQWQIDVEVEKKKYWDGKITKSAGPGKGSFQTYLFDKPIQINNQKWERRVVNTMNVRGIADNISQQKPWKATLMQ